MLSVLHRAPKSLREWVQSKEATSFTPQHTLLPTQRGPLSQQQENLHLVPQPYLSSPLFHPVFPCIVNPSRQELSLSILKAEWGAETVLKIQQQVNIVKRLFSCFIILYYNIHIKYVLNSLITEKSVVAIHKSTFKKLIMYSIILENLPNWIAFIFAKQMTKSWGQIFFRGSLWTISHSHWC